MRDLDGDTVREAMGLRMGTSDFLTWGVAPLPQAMTGLLDLIETGARETANATLFAITNDAVSGARLWLDTSGSYYRLSWTDGTTTRTATLAAGQPTSGQRVRLWWSLASTGALALSQSINGGADTTATAAALTLPASWATGAVIRLNALGDTENPAQAWYRRVKLVPGLADVDTLEAIR